MNKLSDFPIEKYGLIVALAERMNKKQFPFGKTALQKLIYFLQEARGVDVGYQYTLYTYGPFCADLLGDLDVLSAVGAVTVKGTGNMGYHIAPGEEAKKIMSHVTSFTAKHKKDIDEVVDTFGNRYAKELELLATTLYINRDLGARDPHFKRKQLVEVVKGVKPHFDDDEIEGAIKSLTELKFMKPVKH